MVAAAAVATVVAGATAADDAVINFLQKRSPRRALFVSRRFFGEFRTRHGCDHSLIRIISYQH
jgi:hypothetical protein